MEEKSNKEGILRGNIQTNCTKSSIGVQTFCKAFPFHIIFNSSLQLKQLGIAILRALSPEISLKISQNNIINGDTVHFCNVFTIESPGNFSKSTTDVGKILSHSKEKFYISSNDRDQSIWKVNFHF